MGSELDDRERTRASWPPASAPARARSPGHGRASRIVARVQGLARDKRLNKVPVTESCLTSTSPARTSAWGD